MSEAPQGRGTATVREGCTIVVPEHLRQVLTAAYGRRREDGDADGDAGLPDVTMAWVRGDGTVRGPDVAAAQVLFRYFPRDRFPRAALSGQHMLRAVEQLPALKWIHVHAAGVDDQPLAALDNRGLTLTNSAGVMDAAVAEMALALIMAAAKQLPTFARLQAERSWERRVLRQLHGAVVGIVGLGGIGLELARRCSALGMRVWAVKRHPQRLPRGAHDRKSLPLERLLGLEGLTELLAASEYVVLTASLNPSSTGLIDADALAAMGRDAYLINVGRGALVDEAALKQALGQGAIAGALLDVVVDEPIPPASDWYGLPNLYITPHNALKTRQVQQRLCDFFLLNLTRYLRRQPLLNVVIGSPRP